MAASYSTRRGYQTHGGSFPYSVQALTTWSNQCAEEAYLSAAHALRQANDDPSSSRDQRRWCRDLFLHRYFGLQLSIPTKDVFLSGIREVLGQNEQAESQLWNGIIKMQQDLIKELILCPAWGLIIKELRGNPTVGNNRQILGALQVSTDDLFQRNTAVFVPATSTSTSSTRSDSSPEDLQEARDTFEQEDYMQAHGEDAPVQVHESFVTVTEQDAGVEPEQVSMCFTGPEDTTANGPQTAYADTAPVLNTFIHYGKYEPSDCPAQSCPGRYRNHFGNGRSTIACSVADPNDVGNENDYQFNRASADHPRENRETAEDALLGAETFLAGLEMAEDKSKINGLAKLAFTYLAAIPENGNEAFWQRTQNGLLKLLQSFSDISEAKELLEAIAIATSHTGCDFVSILRNTVTTLEKITFSSNEVSQLIDAWIYCHGNSRLFSVSANKIAGLVATSVSILNMEHSHGSQLSKVLGILESLTYSQLKHISPSHCELLQGNLEKICSKLFSQGAEEERSSLSTCLTILSRFQQTEGYFLGLNISAVRQLPDLENDSNLFKYKQYVVQLLGMNGEGMTLPDTMIKLLAYTHSLEEILSILFAGKGPEEEIEVKSQLLKIILAELSDSLKTIVSSDTSDDSESSASEELKQCRAVLRAIMKQRVDSSLFGTLEWALDESFPWQYGEDRNVAHRIHYLLLGLLFGPEVLLEHLDKLELSQSANGVDAIRALSDLLDLQERPSCATLVRALTTMLKLSKSANSDTTKKWKSTLPAMASCISSIARKLVIVTDDASCADHLFRVKQVVLCIANSTSSKCWPDAASFVYESLWALVRIFKAWPELDPEVDERFKFLITSVQQVYAEPVKAWNCSLELQELIASRRR